MRKIAIVALLFICSACFVYGKDAVDVKNVDTQDAAAAPVENYKPLETDVEGEFKDEINDNMDGDESLNEEDSSDDELMNEEEPLEDEGNAVDSNDIETDLQGDTDEGIRRFFRRRFRRRRRICRSYRRPYKKLICGRTRCRRWRRCLKRRCTSYRLCSRTCYWVFRYRTYRRCYYRYYRRG